MRHYADLRKRFESEGRTAKMYLDYQHGDGGGGGGDEGSLLTFLVLCADDLTLQKAESVNNVLYILL